MEIRALRREMEKLHRHFRKEAEAALTRVKKLEKQLASMLLCAMAKSPR